MAHPPNKSPQGAEFIAAQGETSPRTITPPASQITETGKWMVLLAAFLGWMFDGLEMGIFPQVARASLNDLLADAATEGNIIWWHQTIDALFLLGAAAGGLVFGWLGDKVGRVRAMSLSILVYSLFTGLCYFAQAPWHIGAMRFISAVGMGGEWSLGVALVMEVWPAKNRPILAGLIGAAANVGFLLISFVCYLYPVNSTSWRWVMLSGALPALLTFFIRLFVPESERWQASQKIAPSAPLREVFSRNTARVMVLAIVFASIALLGTWGAVQKIPAWADKLPGADASTKSISGMLSAAGAIVGCLIAPFIGARLGRRPAYFLLCVASLVACAILFRGLNEVNGNFWLMTFIVGSTTAAFYGWLPLYLPELFPTRVRATAQGIAYNFGRIFAAGGAFAGGSLVKKFWEDDYGQMAAALSLIYIAGLVLIWFAPETKGKPLPE